MALSPRALVHFSTGRTNMCREQASTITNAQTVRSFPHAGSSHPAELPVVDLCLLPALVPDGREGCSSSMARSTMTRTPSPWGIR